MNFWQDRALTGTGCVFYGLAFLFALIPLLRRKEYPHLLFLALLIGGFVFQSFGLYVRGLEVHAIPLTNTFEVFQVLAWASVALNFILRQMFQLRLLNFFSSAFGFGLSFVSLAVASWDDEGPPLEITGSPWVGFHAVLAIFSYGVFAVLALTSLMYLLQDRALARKQTGGWFSMLPAIRQLEVINAKLISLGVSLLTIAVAIGFLNWAQAPGAVGFVKLTIAMGVWLAYLITMLQRQRKKLVARHFARMCLALFIVALISLWPLTHRTAALPIAHGVDYLDDAHH
ncbi:cytochrome C assembly family protein [Cerasicoccus arenae]|uniref:Cytochrome c assembly protein n=1 Tax=Cerasicoccus arenae TaxID=424488 RepID=A0A8J3DGH5_9BACT|nr:cytochrome c biogenesis protein CcsA [Cerasicoccus arenae]MBK1859533.1 cytochrome c biogenesis protein CcsA [Cerasicoccus arenae]GHB97195.1 cytochrome c assembly protein [Cerasicoccus arenae]